jgi:hypothetical protein
MKNAFKLLTLMVGVLAIALLVVGCTPKKSPVNASANAAAFAAASSEATFIQIPTKSSIDNENNPITLANWAFELIMQMEGRDENERDPAVAEALAAVYERAGELPGGGYTIFSIEVERLYMGDLPEDEKTANFLIEGTTLARYTGNEAYIIIPSSVTVIGEAAFIVLPGGTSLESVTIPSSVTIIGERAFQNCAYMTSVTFISPSSVTYIGDDAFLGCSSLTSIDIPSSVGRIWIGAFEECASLTSVTMSGRTDIAGDAFPEDAQIRYRD